MNEPGTAPRKFYVVGGTMPPDSPSYIERNADAELFDRVMGGEFCYVLTTRQMGKSSLMARSAQRLRADGVRTAVIDLTLIGGEKEHVSADQWYYGFSYRLLRELQLGLDLAGWWRARTNLPALQRLTEFFGDVVLAGVPGRVAVFVDEIETTIGLPFADDFFAAIRACYNARAVRPDFERLSFVLLGVATPPQLIQDPRRTPFNIGHRIELADFSRDEARWLVAGLGNCEGDREEILDRILHWTSGHPYLTQKLCQAAAEQPRAEGVNGLELVDRLVDDFFFAPQALRNEANLKFAASRLTENASRSSALLKLLTRIRMGALVVDDPTSPLHAALKLSGVIAPCADGRLAVRNRIYEQVFTAKWAKADRLLGATWRRRALRHAAAGERDQALYAGLKALVFEPNERYRQEVAQLAGDDYGALLATFRHAGPLTSVALSPDGTTVLTGSEDGTARLWDGATGDPCGSALQHRDAVWVVAFSPDGATALTGSADHTARLWSVETGLPLGPVLKHRGAVWSAAFSPDGARIVTASEDQTARLWNAADGAPTGVVLRHEAPLEAALFSPDGRAVATAGADNAVRLWNAATGAPLAAPLLHGCRVVTIAFSPDGRNLLTAGEDKIARLWSVDSARLQNQAFHHEGWIRALAFSPDGKFVLSGSEDQTARLWRADSGVPVGRPLRHEGLVRKVAFSPSGTVVLTGSEDQTARLWSASSGEPLGGALRHAGRIVALAFSPAGLRVLTASADRTARLWRADAAALQGPGAPLLHSDRVAVVALSPDGRLALTGSEDCRARLWDARTGERVGRRFLHEAAIRVVVFGPEGKTVLTAGDDRTAQLWSVETGKAMTFPLRHEDRIRTAALSADGATVLTGSADHTARLWNAQTGEPRCPPLRHEGEVRVVLFSPDGRAVLSASSDNTARLWSIETGASLCPALFHEGPVQAVAFSPDGRIVATGSYDHTARLWSAQSGMPLSVPMRHEGPVAAVAFSPDGKFVLTGSEDHTARLWRADSGAPVGRPLRHEMPVRTVDFSPDGKTLICATSYWVHAYSATAKPVASRLLAGVWTGAYRWASDRDNALRAALRPTPDSVVVAVVELEPSGCPIEGDAEALLNEWGAKLALRADERDRIVPRWPLAGRRQPRPFSVG